MTPREFSDLERAIGRAVDALPPPRAPRTLLPRVMADVEATVPVGVRHRPWFAWSPLARAALVVVSLFVLTAAWWLWPLAWVAGGYLPESVQQAGRQAEAVATTAGDLLQVGSLVWQAVLGPVVRGLFLLTVVLCTACALIAAALGRIALGGAHQS